MSTRTSIKIGDKWLYHHHDGYPSGVGSDLTYYAGIAHGMGLRSESEFMAFLKNRPMSPMYGHRDPEYEDISEPPGDSEFIYVVKAVPKEDPMYDEKGDLMYDENGRYMTKKGVAFNVECIPIDWDEDPDSILVPKDDIPYSERRYVSTRKLSPYELGDSWGVPVRNLKVGGMAETGGFTITRVNNAKPGVFGILRRP